MENGSADLLLENLSVTIKGNPVVKEVSFSLSGTRTLALVGESGSGKTMTALAIMGLLPSGSSCSGRALFKGRNIPDMSPSGIRELRGTHMAMVFQEPFSSLNPVMRAGAQILEPLLFHGPITRRQARNRAEELLEMVGLSDEVMNAYPHELSGGMRQRVMLAIALSCGPDLMILDEPTTALDVTIQKNMLDLVQRIQRQEDLSVIFITHDFSIVRTVADDVCVMKQGAIVEKGPVNRVLNEPSHPYTRKLIECIPRIGDKRKRLPSQEYEQNS